MWLRPPHFKCAQVLQGANIDTLRGLLELDLHSIVSASVVLRICKNVELACARMPTSPQSRCIPAERRRLWPSQTLRQRRADRWDGGTRPEGIGNAKKQS